jgi:hypothetical protein
MESQEELTNRFTYHPPTNEQVEKYQAIRKVGHLMASMITEFCPDSRELAIALTKIDEAVMWSNASIARNT